MSELAIASVMPQEWEQPYEAQQALVEGTIFPQLNMPFFVEEQMKKKEVTPLGGEEGLLLELQQTTFFLVDLTLFLDTHPGHAEANTMKAQLQRKRKELLKQFASEYAPLTMDCEGEAKVELVPWEGGKDYVAL